MATTTLATSQSTPPADINQASTAKASSQVGVGAANDDKGSSTTYVPSASTASSVVTPAPNALDQYASYTYSLSWYLLTPEQQAAVIETGKLNTNGWALLMQSAGAPVKDRNKYFSLDYYMDNLEIETTYTEDVISAVTGLSFTVTEPNGITLISNINKAARDLYKQNLDGLSQKAFFVMVIRFYGWDANGNLVTKTAPAAGTSNTINSSNAAVVKFYPFQIRKITFTAASKAVEYRIEGIPLEIKYAMSSALGSVPHPIELVGETVNDVLNGTITNVKAGDDGSKRQTSVNPPGTSRDSVATSTLTGGSYNPDTGAVGYATGA